MAEYIAIGIFWLLGCYAVFRDVRLLLFLFFCSLCFGSFTVVPVSLTAGLTINPTSVLCVALTTRLLISKDGVDFLLQSTSSFGSLKFLKIYCIISVVATLLLSRLFAEQIYVYSLRNVEYTLLKPTTQNLTQLMYVLLSCFTAVALARLLRQKNYLSLIIYSLCTLTLLLVVTGLLDSFELLDILTPFRNGTYTVHAEHNVLGAKRVIGLMPEASSYATLCVSIFAILYFLRRYCVDQYTRAYIIPACLLGLGCCIWFSASSTGLIGVFALSLVIIYGGLKKFLLYLFAGLASKRDASYFLGAVIALLLLLLIGDWFLKRLYDMLPVLDVLLFQKVDSQSYSIRSAQNIAAWRAFIDSHFLGIGLGSTRTSSSVLAVLSGVGLLGALALYGQLVIVGLKPYRAVESEVIGILVYRSSMVPIFVMGAVSGSVADFGPLVAFLIAFSAASNR